MFVRFFDDVPVADQRQILLDQGATQPGGGLLIPGPTAIWAVILPGVNVDDLAERDEVRFIEPTTPPVEEDLDQVRGEIGAAAVDYDGAGETIAQWEGCQPTTKHPDMQGRVHPIGMPRFTCREWKFQDVNRNNVYDMDEPIGVDRDEDGIVETILNGNATADPWTDLAIRVRPLVSRRYLDVGDIVGKTDANDITFDVLTNSVQPIPVPSSEVGATLIPRDYYSEFHPTMVAGIVIGNSESNTIGSFSPQPKFPGIVPAASIRSYAWNHFSKTLEYPDAIAAGARVSTNSFGWSSKDYHFDSAAPPYPNTAQFYDEVASGRAPNGTPSGLAARMLIVASSGNEGDNAVFWRTGRIVNSAKNVIAVGNVSSADFGNPGVNLGLPALDSGRGPTMDGRLTPILSAPGTESNGDRGITSTSLPEAKYDAASGTSFSTPAVSGAAAQLRGVYTATCQFAPEPQELRALLTHSARDLAYAPNLSKVPPGTELIGPDFVFGYGLVQVDAAAALVKQAVTDTIESGWVEHRVSLNNTDQLVVNGGVAQLRVTLVWDDPPYYTGFPPRNVTGILQNDLDLEIIDPAHNRHLPWVLDASSGNEADPAVRRSRPPLLYVLQSYRDHRNTIEQVVVDVPSGLMNKTWTIRVRGFKLYRGPQSYTLVSEVFQSLPMTACGSFSNGSTVYVENPLDLPDTIWGWMLFWLGVIILLWLAFEAAILLFATVAGKYGTSLALFGIFALLALLAAIFYALVGLDMLAVAALVLFGILFALAWVIYFP
jgi:subtilisin family serine protease